MIIKDKIEENSLQAPFIKAAADVKREIVSIGCELHIDCAEELAENGSKSNDLWGFNIYPDKKLDFISLINIRPADNNRTMEIKSEEIRDKIKKIVEKLF